MINFAIYKKMIFGNTLITAILLCCFLSNIKAQTKEEKIDFCQKAVKQKTLSEPELKKLRTYLADSMFDIKKAAANALVVHKDDSDETLKTLAKYIDQPSDVSAVIEKDENTRSVAAYTLLQLGAKGKAILKERAHHAPALRTKVAAVLALYSSADAKDTIGLGNVREQLYKELEIAFNPAPDINPNNPLKDPAFAGNNINEDWEFIQKGATGTAVIDKQSRRPGSGSLMLQKSTHGGELYLKTKNKIKVNKGERCLVRIYFRADDAPFASTLQIVFEDKNGKLTVGEDRYAGQSQMFIRNAVPGKWHKRLAHITPKEDTELSVGLLLKGSAATVYIDDVTVPAKNANWDFYSVQVEDNEIGKSALINEIWPSTNATLTKTGSKTRFMVNKKPVVPAFYTVSNRRMGKYGDYRLMEGDAGITTQVVRLDFSNRDNDGPGGRPVWKPNGDFDFSTTFEEIEYAIATAPKSNFLLNINIAWPKNWGSENPDDVWKNVRGQKAYGTTVHLTKFSDELPDEKYSWFPSPFSQKAIADAQEGIQLFVTELKKKPYFNKFIGCHISGGHDGQFYTGGWPDYSPAAVTSFRKWLKDIYKTDKELQKSWRDDTVSLATAAVPNYSKRRSTTSALFYNPATDQCYVDHTRFQMEQGMVLRDEFAKAFKEAMGKSVVTLAWALGGGRGQGTETIFMPSKNLDVLVAQPTYARRLPGYVGGMRNVPITSYKEHGKLLIKELDFRTWIRNNRDETYAQRLSTAENADAFKDIFRKEYMQMFASGMGFWMYDIDQSGFKDPGMLKSIKEGIDLYIVYELNTKVNYRPDVAMVWVDESLLWEKQAINVNNGITLDGYTNFYLGEAGFTFDNLYLNDILQNPELQKYKVYIFKDAWRLTKQQRTQIEQKLQKDGKTLVWNYAAGYVGDDKLSDTYVQELTKIKVAAEDMKQWPVLSVKKGSPLVDNMDGYIGTLETVAIALGRGVTAANEGINIPRFVVKDNDATVLATYSDNRTAIAVKEFPAWTSVYFGILGSLDARLLNNVVKKAGGHVFLESGVGNVEFNGNVLGIHFLKNTNATIKLPFKCKVIDYDSKKVLLANGTSFVFKAKAGESNIFVVDRLN